MTSPPPATGPHVDAVLALLGSFGVATYLAEAPRGTGNTLPARPYVVLFPTPGTTDGTLGDPGSELLVSFQCTAVGDSPEQAMWLHDRLAVALASTPIVAGRTVLGRIEMTDSQPVRRDDTLADPLFYAITRWQLHTL